MSNYLCDCLFIAQLYPVVNQKGAHLTISCINFQQYWAQASLDKNKALVDYLKQYGAIRTDKVAEVMETIDRGLFVPEGSPYIDSPMPIGFNATISAPHMHATCLELLKDHLQPGMHALDVGSGVLPIFYPSGIMATSYMNNLPTSNFHFS